MDQTPDFDLDTLVLRRGSHPPSSGECCLVEAVNRYVLLKPDGGDQHPCAALGPFARNLNDAFGDDDVKRSAMLREFVPRLAVAEVSEAVTKRRGLRCLDWLVRHWLPAWLDLVPALSAHATALRELPVVTEENAEVIGARVREADDAARAARSAAWSAAESAARSAAWSAARSAAWSAAESAARSAAWSAAWSAARSAAWSAAESAARSAAWSAAWSVLQPTVEQLQADAVVLLRELCEMRDEPEDKAAE